MMRSSPQKNKKKWHTMFKETVHFVNEADFLGLVSWLERNIAIFGMHGELLLKVFAVNMFIVFCVKLSNPICCMSQHFTMSSLFL